MSKDKNSKQNVNIGTKRTEPSNVQDKQSKNRKNSWFI